MTKKEFIEKYSFDIGKKHLKSDLNSVIQYESIKFGIWYSGMDSEKVIKAYERYLKETT